MIGRARRALGCALAAAALVSTALAVPTSAVSHHAALAGPGRLALDPAVPIVGERPRLEGRAPTPARRLVKLQVRRADGSWRTIERRQTKADRRFGFRLAPAGPSVRRLRVVAPAVGEADDWRSTRISVRGVTQQVDLVVPTEARAGEPVLSTAIASPARPGRPVRLLVGDTVAGTAVQDALGRAVVTVTAPAAGTSILRATVLAARGAAAVTSAPSMLRTESAVTGIPRVDIVTDDGEAITDKEIYKRATFSVDPRDSGVPEYEASARLRVRGNFTATASTKLPYRIKLDDSERLVGLPTSKDWVLLANFYDRTLLRTTLGMEAGRRLGLPWSPRFVDAEVWLNGEFKGLYQLGEGIEVDGDRVDIELADEASDAATGGYLLEADDHEDADPSFETTRGLRTFVKDPGAEAAFLAGVTAHVQGFEDALYSADFADPVSGYAAWIDVDSFVDWYLVMELLKNCDAAWRNSVYLQRTVGGRLSMGPVWDFDISAGNRVPWDLTEPTGWFVRKNWYGLTGEIPSQITGPEGHWWVRLFQDPAFEQRVRDRWAEVRAGLLALPAHLQARRGLIEEAALRNFAAIADGGAGHPQGPTPADPEFAFRHWATWDESTDALVAWLSTRLAWMDGQLS